MICEIYVLESKDDIKKIIWVEKKQFSFGSKEAIEAKQKEQEIFVFAKSNGYRINGLDLGKINSDVDNGYRSGPRRR